MSWVCGQGVIYHVQGAIFPAAIPSHWQSYGYIFSHNGYHALLLVRMNVFRGLKISKSESVNPVSPLPPFNSVVRVWGQFLHGGKLVYKDLESKIWAWIWE